MRCVPHSVVETPLTHANLVRLSQPLVDEGMSRNGHTYWHSNLTRLIREGNTAAVVSLELVVCGYEEEDGCLHAHGGPTKFAPLRTRPDLASYTWSLGIIPELVQNTCF